MKQDTQIHELADLVVFGATCFDYGACDIAIEYGVGNEYDGLTENQAASAISTDFGVAESDILGIREEPCTFDCTPPEPTFKK